MSMVADAVRLIVRKGGATVDELVPEMGCTRLQAKNALKNAAKANRIHIKSWKSRTGEGGGAGRLPPTYYPGPKPSHYDQLIEPPRVIQRRPPCECMGASPRPADRWRLAAAL